MKLFNRKPKLRLVSEENIKNDAVARDLAAETHLKIMVEQMVRDGHSVRAIEAAVRQAA